MAETDFGPSAAGNRRNAGAVRTVQQALVTRPDVLLRFVRMGEERQGYQWDAEIAATLKPRREAYAAYLELVGLVVLSEAGVAQVAETRRTSAQERQATQTRPAELGTPPVHRVATYPPQADHRPLANIYVQLGQALLARGDEERASERVERAQRSYTDAVQAFRAANREQPDRADLYLYLADADAARGQYAATLQAYLEAVRLEPGYAVKVLPVAHVILTRELALTLGDIEDRWQRLVDARPLSHESRAAMANFLGRVYLYRDEYGRAIDHFTRARELNPGDMYTLEGLGEALWRDGQIKQAAQTLEEAARAADQSNDPERRAAVRLKWAQVLIELQQYDKSQEVIHAGMSLSRRLVPEFQVALARCHLARGETQAARRLADQVVASDAVASPVRIDAFVVGAQALLQARDYAASATAAENALSLNPAHVRALRLRGEALIAGRIDAEQGIRLLQVYLQGQPGDFEAHRLLIGGLRDSGRPATELVMALTNAIRAIHPEQRPPLQLELAEAYLRDDQAATAVATLEAIDRDAPAWQSAVWWRLFGDAHRQLDQPQTALDDYRRGLELDPTDSVLLRHHAELLHSEGRMAEASRAWAAVIGHAPADGYNHLRRAQALQALGSLEEALEEVESAVALGVGDEVAATYALHARLLEALKRPARTIAAAYLTVGMQYYWEGDWDKSIPFFQLASQADPDYAPTYWYWADTLRVQSYTSEPPHVDEKLIRQSRILWWCGIRKQLPDKSFAWVYLARARICEQEAQLPKTNEWDRKWQAVAYIELAILLGDDNAIRGNFLANLHRSLDNWTNALHAASKALDHDADDIDAMDEKIAVLIDTGDYAVAEEVLNRRREIMRDVWTDYLLASLLFRTRQFDAAIALFSNLIDAEPENLRHRALRAACYLNKDKVSDAQGDWQWIWNCRDEPRYSKEEAGFAWAAYVLGAIFASDQLNLLDEAIRRFKKLLGDPLNAPYAHRNLGVCYLARGNAQQRDADQALHHFRLGIHAAKRIVELDDLLVDLLDLQKAQHVRTQAPTIQEVIREVQRLIDEQRSALQRPSSPEVELERLVRMLDGTEKKSWAWIGAQAGLARLYAERESWIEAAKIYERLIQQPRRFPRASVGFLHAINGLRDEGNTQMEVGELSAAEQRFRQALDLITRTLPFNPGTQADLQASIGYARFEQSDVEGARREFIGALERYRQSGAPSPGEKLGMLCQSLLRDVSQYWRLDADWSELAEEGVDATLRPELAAAREGLAGYLDELYQVARPVEPEEALLPVVLELGRGLIPPDAAENWRTWLLFSTYIPEMKDRIKTQMGVEMPGVHVRGNNTLAETEYVVQLDEVPLVKGSVPLGLRYAPVAPSMLQELGIPPHALTEALHPLTGEPGCWVPAEFWEQLAGSGGGLLAEPLVYVMLHLEAVLRRNLVHFLGVQEAKNLLTTWEQREGGAALIQAALPNSSSRLRFTRLLRTLVNERVPLTAPEEILQTVQEHRSLDDLAHLVRAVRLRLKRQLPGNTPDARRYELSANWEAAIAEWLRHEDGRTAFVPPQDQAHELLCTIRAWQPPPAGNAVLVTHHPELRPYVRRLVEFEFPDLLVLSSDELLRPDELLASSPEAVVAQAEGVQPHG